VNSSLPNVFVTTPANNSVNLNVSLTISSLALTGATTYTIDISPQVDFSSGVISMSGAKSQPFTALAFNTKYYTRVKTDLSPVYGPITSFTTASSDYFSYVKTPANNATAQQVNLSVMLNAVIGATNYTMELNTDPNFGTGTALTKSGTTTSYAYTNLQFNTPYYSRVMTNLSPNWGPTKMFTTGTPQQLCYVASPANNAINVSYLPTVTVTNIGDVSYTVELSPVSDFSSGIISATSATTKVVFTTTLNYGTVYYSRVKSPLTSGAYGPTRTFTTGTPTTLSYVLTPANNAINVPYTTNVTANLVPNATTYTIEINTDPAFGVGTAIVKSGAKTIAFALAYKTTYHTRVYTDLNTGSWGVTKSFTTGDPLSLAYVTSPKNNSSGVPSTVNVSSNPVPGATSYTIEVNTASDFSGTSILRSGSTKILSFSGMVAGTTYYTRVKTNVDPVNWGTTNTSFTISPTGARSANEWEGEVVEEEAVSFEPGVVSVYPNPFSETLKVHAQTDTQDLMQVMLFDMSGKEIVRQNGITNNIMDIEPGEISAGLYIIKVVTKDGVTVKKVVK
jgi:hypothetical protein